jgi:ABC-2 type transport system ATP-binding protein
VAEAAGEAVIEADELLQSYGELRGSRRVAARGPRELFALLGTNGAGKTTTIEVLEGLQPPTSGRVRVLGMDPRRDRSTLRQRTGVMLQSGGFTGALTVGETVELWRSLTPRPRPTTEALEFVELRGRVACALSSCPAASAAGWSSPSPSWDILSCSSSMNRPAAWIRPPAAGRGSSSAS